MLGMVYKVAERLFAKKSINFFPSKSILADTAYTLKDGSIHTPVTVKEGFRDRLEYYVESCNGCGLCSKVCPANAIELYTAIVNEKNQTDCDLFVTMYLLARMCYYMP